MTQLADDKLNMLRELRQLWMQQRKQIENLSKEQKRIETLLRALEPNSKGYKKASSQSLIAAVESGHSLHVQQMLQAGADPNARTMDGESVLQLAVSSNGNEKIVRALLDFNAEVDSRDDDGNTPLIVCVDNERIKTVKLLIEHGADVNAKNGAGDTPLTNAACWGSAKSVLHLLKHGADPTIRDGSGLTALALARQHHHTSIVKRLEQAVTAVSVT